MQFDGFEIHSIPYLRTERNCECGGKLHTIHNGLISSCFFCEDCQNVYLIKMVKVAKKKVSREFLKAAREEINKKSK